MSYDERLVQLVQSEFCKAVDLSQEEVFGSNLTLAAILTKAAGLTNSVDLMEAFAKTAKAVRKEQGIRLRLPALPLDTPINEAIGALLQETRAQSESEETRVD